MNSTPTNLSFGITATSKMYAEEFQFQWAIDVSSSPNVLTRGISGIVMQSPLFSGGTKLKYSWRLDLRINKPATHQLMVTLVRAGETDSSTDGQLSAFAFAIYKGSPETAGSITGSPPCYQQMRCGHSLNTCVNFKNFGAQHIPNNILLLYCKIYIYCGTEQIQSDMTPTIVNSSNDAIARSLETVLHSGDLSDVQIVTASKTIPAHKIILAARSPVFAAMFRANLQEANMNFVEIGDFDTNVVDAMMEFIYTGQTELSTSKFNTMDLLRISDKYELLGLKSDIEKLLQSTVKMENAVELFILAYLHNCNDLKKAAIDFINVNKTLLSGTEEFKTLGSRSHPGILNELFLSTYKKNMCDTESFMTLATTHPEMLMQLYLAT